jgi:uncharacterized C2H2 Zn-finger protein
MGIPVTKKSAEDVVECPCCGIRLRIGKDAEFHLL